MTNHEEADLTPSLPDGAFELPSVSKSVLNALMEQTERAVTAEIERDELRDILSSTRKAAELASDCDIEDLPVVVASLSRTVKAFREDRVTLNGISLIMKPMLAAIDNSLRNGSHMTGANLAFNMLCMALRVDRDSLEFDPDWARDNEAFDALNQAILNLSKHKADG